MMPNLLKKFLIVDDDSLSNLLCKMVLNKTLSDIQIKTFLIPEEALEYIDSLSFKNQNEEKTILFLDINMPSMTGWEFLEIFKNFEEKIKKQFTIYILSSSISLTDIESAKHNSLVTDFIEKPLTKEIVAKLFS